MRIALPGLALLVVIGRLTAATYYVDYVGGSDANAGTHIKIPWQHCPGDPAATGNVTATSLAPGDFVIFKGGVEYQFTGQSGIALKWTGVQGAAITYDGNSAGNWGLGRALFTDGYSAHSITAFHAAGIARHLVFRNLEFAGIGGAASLPWDAATAAAPRYGGGIGFAAGCESVTITGCHFRELGFWFNQRPMGAASIQGTGISSKGATRLTISDCEFSRLATAVDFSSGGTFSEVKVTQCAFRAAIVWPVELPPGAGGSGAITVSESFFDPDDFFSDLVWKGYGQTPRTQVVEVSAGTNLKFGAQAVSSTTTTFQWRRNGIVIPGANGPVLNLGAVSLAHSGIYTALATNAGGSTLSNSAIVVVDGTQAAVPVIVTEPLDTKIPFLGSASFSVVANGTPAPTYQWMKDGVPIPGATKSTLSLSSLTADAGYSVLVSNAAGSVTSRTASLLVAGKPLLETTVAPAFSAHPASVVTTVGDSVMFIASASGTPSPTYQWHKDGAAIPGASNASFTLTGVTLSDAGRYSVAASNSAGSIVSNDATLTVNQAPVFTLHPQSQSVAQAGSVTLTVAANGTPAPTFQWRKNGIAISGATQAALQLSAVSANDQASYSVVATNSAGTTVSNEATVTVEPAEVASAPPAPEPPPAVPTVSEPAPTPPAPSSVVQIANQLVTLERGWRRNVDFVIGGSGPRRILVRAVGPSLGALGMSGVLTDPYLQIAQGKAVLHENDNWGGSADLMQAFSQAGAMPFLSIKSLDSALLMIVAPGAYSAMVSSANGGAGNVLVEVYEFQ